MARTTGILLFNDVEELDFAGPWEVFATAGMLDPDARVVAVAEGAEPVRCAKGLRVLPDHTLADAPPLDVLLVPGGQGTRREVENTALLDWLRKTCEQAEWVTSVCTGVLLLHACGVARNRRVATHWAFVDALRARGEIEVVADARYVRDGKLVTAAGISAGIDMALWLVGQWYGPEGARRVQQQLQYHPEPPYALKP